MQKRDIGCGGTHLPNYRESILQNLEISGRKREDGVPTL